MVEEEEKYHYRRRYRFLVLVAALFVCLLSSFAIIYNSRSSSYEVIRRLSHYKHKRIRTTHKVYDNDESNIVNSGITRDSHGLLVEVAIQQHKASIQTKIINGIDFERMAHPYIVRIHWTNPGKNADKSKYPAICGGSLISPTIVLTAAREFLTCIKRKRHCMHCLIPFFHFFQILSHKNKTHTSYST